MTDKPPAKNHDEFSARLQVLHLTSDTFALVFDQWDGPSLPNETSRYIKDQTGARAVLFFRGVVDIGC